MFKRMAFVGICAFGVSVLVGCDEATLAKLAPDAAKMLMMAPGSPAGDLLTGQLQTLDRLRDGTGSLCPNPGGPGTCDGTGPYGDGGSGNRGPGYGTGKGEGDRLRDGSCGD